MEVYYIAFVIVMIITFWSLYNTPASFTDNDNAILGENITQPSIIHKINIPSEW